MLKNWHPENMIRGNWYKVSYPAGQMLATAQGRYDDLERSKTALMLRIITRNGNLALIPIKMVVNCDPPHDEDK